MSIDKIIVHCSASPQDRGDDAATIHRWHKERGFDGIGYHAVILENGDIQYGRPVFWTGAHCKGYNTGTLGVCLIGMGGDATEQQLFSLVGLIKIWRKDNPGAEIAGHNEYSDKSCPGFNVKYWWQNTTDSEA